MEKTDIGLIGLAVMGENLALNMESKGFQTFRLFPVLLGKSKCFGTLEPSLLPDLFL